MSNFWTENANVVGLKKLTRLLWCTYRDTVGHSTLLTSGKNSWTDGRTAVDITDIYFSAKGMEALKQRTVHLNDNTIIYESKVSVQNVFP
jgi:hypothetical protein